MRINLFILVFLYSGIASGATPLNEMDYFGAKEAIQKSPAVVLTVASDMKVHGPHLPLGTDAILAGALATALAKHTKAAILPNLTLGWYPQFSNFNLQALSADTIQRVTREYLDGILQVGAKRIFILNFDVERSSGLPLGIVISELRQKYRRPIILLSWHDFVDEKVTAHLESASGHADELETSLMLHLAPNLVQKDKLQDIPEPSAKAFDAKGLYPIILDTPDKKTPFSVPGQFGFAKRASAEKGKKSFDALLANILFEYEKFLRLEP